MENVHPLDAARLRRERLRVEAAPHPRHDAIVTLQCDVAGAALRLRYVPDRDLLEPTSLTAYLEALDAGTAPTLEALAQTILEDVNDQVIPCWIEVTLRRTDGTVRHDIRIEDRQPRWQDRGLLERLEP